MIYENIVRISKKKGLSLMEVEKKAGLGQGAISKWKKSTPTVRSLKKVADALGCSVATLLK